MEILDFCAAHYPTGPLVMETRLATNGQRLAYRVRGPGGRYVVKLTDPGRPEAVVRADVGTPAYLAAQGFPAPRPLPTLDGRLYLAYGDRFVYLYEYLEGAHPAARAEFYARLGDLLARLHRLPPNGHVPESIYNPQHELAGVRAALAQVDDFIGDPGELTPAEQRAILPEVEALIERFPSFEDLPRGIIHSDPYFVNLIERPGGDLALIDWEDGGVSYPLLDVGYVLAHLCTFTARDRALWGVAGPAGGLLWRPDWARVFLDAYQAQRPLSAAERQRLPDAVRLSFLAYLPNWGTHALILDNYRRMKMVDYESMALMEDR